MAYDLFTAQAQLASYLTSGNYTLDQLLDLAKQVDVDVDVSAYGSITVLYSRMGNLPAEMADNPNIRILDKTAAFELLSSQDFRIAAGRRFGVDPNDMINKSFTSDVKKAAENWLFHGKDGPWAAISKNFADATTGEVLIMTSAPNMAGVLVETEIPALEGNNAITKINGIAKSDLMILGGGDVWNNTVLASSVRHTMLTKPGTRAVGCGEARTASIANDAVPSSPHPTGSTGSRSHAPAWECRLGRSSGPIETRDAGASSTAFPRRSVGTRNPY